MELGRREELYPFCGIVATEDVKIGFKFLISLFGLSICLRVVCSGEANIIFEEMSQFFGKGGGKLRATIRDERVM